MWLVSKTGTRSSEVNVCAWLLLSAVEVSPVKWDLRISRIFLSIYKLTDKYFQQISSTDKKDDTQYKIQAFLCLILIPRDAWCWIFLICWYFLISEIQIAFIRGTKSRLDRDWLVASMWQFNCVSNSCKTRKTIYKSWKKDTLDFFNLPMQW